MNHEIEIIGTVIFSIAVLHSFVASKILSYSHSFENGSWQSSVGHFLGEIELVFGLWAAVFLLIFSLHSGTLAMIQYQESIHFTEPLFVFAIMVIASTRPVLEFVRRVLSFFSHHLAKTFRLNQLWADLFIVLVFGPLSGSLITEPAAMTVTALLLNSMIVSLNSRMVIALLATLFVNVSIGGALTAFAAPPILMVAKTWSWDSFFVVTHFGFKSVIAVMLNAGLWLFVFRKSLIADFDTLKLVQNKMHLAKVPFAVSAVHLFFLGMVVLLADHPSLFIGVFLFFLGFTVASGKHQSTLRFREALLVAFFLAGIMVFGPVQKWWLKPLLQSLSDTWLFVSATLLTSITDNAALTYLGSQVPDLADREKFALVAGAICGGGLTLIANAPNAAGFSILKSKLKEEDFSALRLLQWAIVPTGIAVLCFWFLPFQF